MRAVFTPSTPSGIIKAPPSKSMAHRLLIAAGLSNGVSRVTGIAPSEDVSATVDCLRLLGAKITLANGVATVCGTDPKKSSGATLPCRESGSTLRFFLPLCLLSGGTATLTGSAKLLSRPLSVYETLAKEKGFALAETETAVRVSGRLTAGEYVVPGNVSSQFVSGLLFALPLLDGDSTIKLLPPVESRNYIDLTLAALAEHGVRAEWTDETTLAVKGGQTYFPHDAAVEGDWSNAAPFLALGLDVIGLDADSLQGDRVCTESFRLLDAGRATLDLTDCPDLAPVLMAYAAMRRGGTFTGTHRLRFKESDRGAAMAQELAKFGVDVSVGWDEITVEGGLRAPSETLEGHGDHRVVMALSVLCARTGGTIAGAEAVRKSFPDFFEKLRLAGVRLEYGKESTL